MLVIQVQQENSEPESDATEADQQNETAASGAIVYAVIKGAFWVGQPAPAAWSIEPESMTQNPHHGCAGSDTFLQRWNAQAEFHDSKRCKAPRTTVSTCTRRPFYSGLRMSGKASSRSTFERGGMSNLLVMSSGRATCYSRTTKCLDAVQNRPTAFWVYSELSVWWDQPMTSNYSARYFCFLGN